VGLAGFDGVGHGTNGKGLDSAWQAWQCSEVTVRPVSVG
jgi:hypothetical protein